MHETATPLLDHKEYDVTQTCSKICCCGQLSSILHLDPEEAVLKNTNCFGRSEKRLPYGELGMVEKSTACGCCHSFTSNLSGTNPDTKRPMPMSPGCGCDQQLVDEIVAELKRRMKGRGDTGNIHRSEESVARMQHMKAKMGLILTHMSVPKPEMMVTEAAQVNPAPFEHKEYNVTGCCERICCSSKMLNLEPEEVQFHISTPCANENRRFPYGQLGDVQEGKCCCCVSVNSQHLGAISPGCGCDHAIVSEIAAELKKRMQARGDTGNIQRQEFANKLAKDQDRMLDALLAHLHLEGPPMPPELQKMA